MFQFYNLIPTLTARENVELVAEIARNPMRPEDALPLVGLADRLDRFPGQLSGGEQQRVAVARAIDKRPDALLCDEPTGALDVETGRLVLSAIARANQEVGATTIVITHHTAIAGMAELPDDRRFVVLWAGHDAVANAFDMSGTFNHVALTLAPGESDPPVIAELDRMLAPWGSLGAFGRRDQPSHRFLEDELAEQRTLAVSVPLLFFGVPASCSTLSWAGWWKRSESRWPR